MAVAIGLIIIAIMLFLAAWKIKDFAKIVPLLANIAGIVALFAAIAVFVFPAALPRQTPDDITQTTEKILFEDDFEDGKAQFFRNLNLGEDWEVVVDETGNSVYSINGSLTGNPYSIVSFGDSSWDNYIVEGRVRFLELKGYSAVYIAFRASDLEKYQFAIEPVHNRVELGLWGELGESLQS